MSDLVFFEEYNDGRHIWACRNELGGIHIWAQEFNSPFAFCSYYGGIEVHSPKQVYDFSPEPSHESCWLIGGPCWHDGSSLWFQEQIIPYIREFGINNLLPILKPILTDWHTSNFGDRS